MWLSLALYYNIIVSNRGHTLTISYWRITGYLSMTDSNNFDKYLRHLVEHIETLTGLSFFPVSILLYISLEAGLRVSY